MSQKVLNAKEKTQLRLGMFGQTPQLLPKLTLYPSHSSSATLNKAADPSSTLALVL